MTGRTSRINQMHPVQRLVNGCTPCVASVQPQSLDLNDQVMTGRSTVPRPDIGPQRPVTSSKVPVAIGRVSLIMTGRRTLVKGIVTPKREGMN